MRLMLFALLAATAFCFNAPERINQAKDRYYQGYYPETVNSLQALLAQDTALSASDSAVAWEYIAYGLAMQTQDLSAIRAFQELLRLRPDYRPDTFSQAPEICRLYHQARGLAPAPSTELRTSRTWALLPLGTGHLLHRKYIRGAVLAAAQGGAIAAFFVARNRKQELYDSEFGYSDKAGNLESAQASQRVMQFSFAAFILFYCLGVADGFLSSEESP